MKKIILGATIAISAFSAVPAMADITINLPANANIPSVDYMASKMSDSSPITPTPVNIPVSNNSVVIENSCFDAPAIVLVRVADNNIMQLFAAPQDNITVDVNQINPLNYQMSGTPLVEGINEINNLIAPIDARYFNLMTSGNLTDADFQQLLGEQYTILKDYIKNNPNSPAMPYAVYNLDGEELLAMAENLPSGVSTSIFYPMIEGKVADTKKQLEAERAIKEMTSGSIDAPGFTLKDLQGKDVSLSDFRGKWVILDFWGSWCIWCIKGFPELKEAYEKYNGKLEIIGIDCNETQDAWRAGVEKYKLPWVNVYCPDGNPLFSEYKIQGFPTKAIVSPQGKLMNVTTGHNPEFFNILDQLINN